MEQISDEQLDKMLGTDTKTFSTYRTLSIDNGSDLSGTGATGKFIEKKFNDVTKDVDKEVFAGAFQGVILSAKAQLVDKGKKPTWRTEEFDMLNKEQQIAIFPLMDGKMIKDISTNQIKKSYATYQDIKKSRSVTQPNGTTQSTYNYLIVLYVGIGDKETGKNEIFKLKFKGTSRGNYFDYTKSLRKMKLKLYGVLTEFSAYKDKATAKYAIGFSVVVDGDGIPVPVNYVDVRTLRIEVAQNQYQVPNKQLGQSSIQQIEEPEVEYEPDYADQINYDDVPTN